MEELKALASNPRSLDSEDIILQFVFSFLYSSLFFMQNGSNEKQREDILKLITFSWLWLF